MVGESGVGESTHDCEPLSRVSEVIHIQSYIYSMCIDIRTSFYDGREREMKPD